MKAQKSLSLIVLMTVVFFPFALYGQEQAGQTANQGAAVSPPVAQPLVPEGVFALELARALRVGQAQNVAQAESLLSAIAIEPRNGWIGEYPITPDIIGEIDERVAAAADAGKLGMGKNQAREAVKDLAARLGLNVTGAPPSPLAEAGPGSGPGNAETYKYIDRNGVVYFTDRYESIPPEYRNQIETIQEQAQPQPYGGSGEEAPGMQPPDYPTNAYPADQYPASPNPEGIDNYYYNVGPPVVTYYAPPWPYAYLYAWVPYPFWCSRTFFPGFYILHDFHRTVRVNQRVFVITNHVVNHKTKAVVTLDPVNRNFRGRSGGSRGTPRQGFMTPSAQASGRAIVGFSQQRGQPSRRGTGTRKATPPSTPGGLQTRVSPNENTVSPGGPPARRMDPGTPPNPPAKGFPAAAGKRPLRPSIGEKGMQKGNQPANPAVAGSPRVAHGGTWAGTGKSVTLPGGNGRNMNPPAIVNRLPMEPRHSVTRGNIVNQKAGTVERPPANERRTLSYPALGGKTGPSTPAGRAPAQLPSGSQKGGFFGVFPRGGKGAF